MNNLTSLASSQRISALRATGLLDTLPERRFDRLTRLLAAALGVPVSLVSLVDLERQFFKSATGLTAPWAARRETPISHSFCRFVVESDAPFVVNDSRSHPLVRDNPAIEELNVAAYLGVPVHDNEGHVLGSLCVIDSLPRKWTELDLDIVRDAAELVQREIVERREFDAVKTSVARWTMLLNTLPHAVWVANPLGQLLGFNDQWHNFTGSPKPEANADPGSWLDYCHPEDRPAAEDAWRTSLQTGTPGEVEFRLRDAAGAYCPVLARIHPVRDESGDIEQWIGSCTDIQPLKTAQAARALIHSDLVTALIAEVSDRAVYAKADEFKNARQLIAHLRNLRDEFG